jgi:geranylgeranyl diphosphate synthase, type I
MDTPVRVVEVPEGLGDIARRVESVLTAVLDDEKARWAALDPELEAPLDALRRLMLCGGKRLRPAFCHWAFVGAGGSPDDPAVVAAGAALEFLQAFALVHDDVMDGSPTRRGARTVHLEFGAGHALDGRRGEARRFGEGVAILVGDLAHVYADQLMVGVPRAALAVWDEMRIELNIGQYLDLVGTARGDTDLEAARRISRYKSGKYTVERPLHLGAALAGRYDELARPLSAYGDPLGEAFQLRDDMLGAFGESAVTGKPVGDDLREGKPTPLLAIASERAAPSDRRLLARIGAPDLTAGEVRDLQRLLVETGARAECEDRIEALTDQAIAAVAEAPIEASARAALAELARFVAWRER